MSAGPRVLVADDQPHNVRLLTRLLERELDATVLAVTDPAVVPGRCERDRPDVVLLDLAMPEPEVGWTVLERLRPLMTAEPPLPVVVLSGHVDEAVRRRALEAGAADAVLKDFDRAGLRELVLRALSPGAR